MEEAITAERAAAPDMVDFIIAMLGEPAGMRFEDAPVAAEEPRPASGLPRDLTGFVFGRLEVLECVKFPSYWRVRCSCGVRKEISREALRRGTRSCGCERLGLGPLRSPDLTGMRFGRWTVLGRARPPRGRTGAFWSCRCECGGRGAVQGKSLSSGHNQSCGCRRGHNGAATAVDLTGLRFCQLTVIGRAEGPTRQGAFWNCACDCGGRTVSKSSHLRSGHTASCGCGSVATQFQPGSNEPPRLPEPERRLSLADELIRDELLTTLLPARQPTADWRWQRRLRNRIEQRCGGSPEDRETRLRVGRIFKAVVAWRAPGTEPVGMLAAA
jgi:hypothetical protein